MGAEVRKAAGILRARRGRKGPPQDLNCLDRELRRDVLRGGGHEGRALEAAGLSEDTLVSVIDAMEVEACKEFLRWRESVLCAGVRIQGPVEIAEARALVKEDFVFGYAFRMVAPALQNHPQRPGAAPIAGHVRVLNDDIEIASFDHAE